MKLWETVTTASFLLATSMCSAAKGKRQRDPSIIPAPRAMSTRGDGNPPRNEGTQSEKKVHICHFDKDESTYKTLVIGKKAGEAHLSNHDKDYAGECLADSFIRESLLVDIPSAQGTEVRDMYTTTYSVSYLKSGIVALAPSYYHIQSVNCSPSAIEILFARPVTPESAALMFPESSVLAVDGVLFDIKCDLRDFEQDMDEPMMASGFLIVQSSEVIGDNIVVVHGQPASMNYIFQEKDILYESTYREDANERRQLFEKVSEAKKSFGYGPLTAEVSLAGKTKSHFAVVRDQFQITGENWWDFDPYVDFAATFFFQNELTIGVDFKIAQSLELFKKEKVFNFVPPLSIPGIGFALPPSIFKLLNKILPKEIELKPQIGLLIEFPFAVAAEVKIENEFTIGHKVTYTTGKQGRTVALKGRPPFELELQIRSTVSEVADFLPITPSDPAPIEPGVSTSFKVNLFGGLKPQLVLDTVGLAKVSIGFYAGLELGAKYEAAPLLPVPFEPGGPYVFNCDKCHNGESELAAVAKEPFLQWRTPLAKKPEQMKLADLSVKKTFLQICFLDSPETTFVVDDSGKGKCCGPDSNGAAGCDVPCIIGSGDLEVEGICREILSSSCEFYVPTAACSDQFGVTHECCVSEIPCTAVTVGETVEGTCVNTASIQDCELPLDSLDCAVHGGSYKCCPIDYDYIPCFYGDFTGSCIHNQACRNRGSIPLPGHCPLHGADIMCCFNDLEEDSCIASKGSYPGTCQPGSSCDSDSLIPLNVFESPEYSCAAGSSCCVECKVDIAEGINCCKDFDCPAASDRCIDNDCVCVQDYSIGIDCCSDDQCGYDFESCIDSKCTCVKGKAGAECCNDDDCPLASDICQYEECICAQDYSKGIECCSEDDCGYDFEDCIDNKCTCVKGKAGAECCEDSDCPLASDECQWEMCQPIEDECDVTLVDCCNSEDCNTGFDCFANVCTCRPDPTIGHCCSNDDCGGEESGAICVFHQCQNCLLGAYGVECCEDSDCGDPVTYQCEGKKCFARACDVSNPLFECCENEDCQDVNRVCDSNTCILKGNPRFTLQWRGEDDLDLHVETPQKVHIYYADPLDESTGGLLDHDDIPVAEHNGDVEAARGRYVENIKFPMDGSSPLGTYRFWVDSFAMYGTDDEWSVSVWVNEVFHTRYTGYGSSTVFTYVK